VPLIFILIILAKPTCHKSPRLCLCPRRRSHESNKRIMGRPDVKVGATDSPPKPGLLKPKSLYNAMQCRKANIKKDERRVIRKEISKGKGKVHPCTGTEALYKPYGPYGE